jgi:hypothetical protein
VTIQLICVSEKRNIFERQLDRFFATAPVGQINRIRTKAVIRREGGVSSRPRILGPALLSLNQRVPGSTLVHPPSKFFNLHRDLRSQVSDVYLAADPNLRK